MFVKEICWLHWQFSREKFSERVHATIPKGIVGGFAFTQVLNTPPPRHSLNFSFVSFIYQMQKCIPGAGLLGKQVMSRTCAVRYSALSVWKAFTSTRNQIYASDTSRNPLQSYLVFHSILDILLKTSFWANFNLPCDIILSYLVKTVFKGTWTEEVRNA